MINSSNFPNTFEQVSFLDLVICTGRQLKFQIHRNFNGKIGLNNTANKLYYIKDEIGLDMLGLSFVHFKKLAKIKFLKYSNT